LLVMRVVNLLNEDGRLDLAASCLGDVLRVHCVAA
jgi:hypothetical protein